MLAHCSIIYAHLWLVRISSSLDTALVVLDSIFLVCIVYFPIIFCPRPGINHFQRNPSPFCGIWHSETKSGCCGYSLLLDWQIL